MEAVLARRHLQGLRKHDAGSGAAESRLRALVAARQVDEAKLSAFALTLYRDYWVEDVDVSTPEAIADAANRAGFDGEQILEMCSDQAIKDELRALTEEAVERGAFGAPTFFVGDQMFWGNDPMHFVEQAARGEG